MTNMSGGVVITAMVGSKDALKSYDTTNSVQSPIVEISIVNASSKTAVINPTGTECMARMEHILTSDVPYFKC